MTPTAHRSGAPVQGALPALLDGAPATAAARRPSRPRRVGKPPVPPGVPVLSGDDRRQALPGPAAYGREHDPIAPTAGGPAGLPGAEEVMGAADAKTVAGAGRAGRWAPARTRTGTVRGLSARDVRRGRAHERASTALGGRPCSG
ncbi:hypothetical protein [Streptomyces nogalater]|uniref:Uncharacterized protein n=1 Tax=Streptomyces nogalater TaxID=38314 RepID=A0ABW0WGM5_STRNO